MKLHFHGHDGRVPLRRRTKFVPESKILEASAYGTLLAKIIKISMLDDK